MCPFICTVTKIQGPKSQMNITKCSIAWRTTSCTKCAKLYISETGHTLDTRFKEHLADITDLNRIQVLADVKHHRDKTVTNHFNQAGHSIHNVRVLGLWLLFKDNRILMTEKTWNPIWLINWAPGNQKWWMKDYIDLLAELYLQLCLILFLISFSFSGLHPVSWTVETWLKFSQRCLFAFGLRSPSGLHPMSLTTLACRGF